MGNLSLTNNEWLVLTNWDSRGGSEWYKLKKRSNVSGSRKTGKKMIFFLTPLLSLKHHMSKKTSTYGMATCCKSCQFILDSSRQGFSG